jgi:hypothetical protein
MKIHSDLRARGRVVKAHDDGGPLCIVSGYVAVGDEFEFEHVRYRITEVRELTVHADPLERKTK